MCILMAADKTAVPLREELDQAACKNPHGFGFAIIAGDRIISERTMNAQRSIDRFLAMREKYPEGHAIWHARIATHGAQNEGNCHPFRVGHDRRTYLGHNGILNLPMAKDEHRSDSRVFAEDVLPSLGGVSALDDPYKRTILEDWVGYNKIAVLTVDPDAMYSLYLLNQKGGKWDERGIWWSNQTHIKPTTYSYSDWGGVYQPKAENFYLAHDWDFDTLKYNLKEGWELNLEGGWERDLTIIGKPRLAIAPPIEGEIEELEEPSCFIECPMCGIATDLTESEDCCTNCLSCFDCGANFQDCLCYVGSAWSGHGY